jgi:hypothetical protein
MALFTAIFLSDFNRTCYGPRDIVNASTLETYLEAPGYVEVGKKAGPTSVPPFVLAENGLLEPVDEVVELAAVGFWELWVELEPLA